MTETTNPLLTKIQLPGKTFRLPSRGYFYKDGEIDESVVNGEILVNSMTTVDEITLRSPEYLFSGEAIERVFKRCIPEVKKPLKLLSKDIDFLLACLRVVSYGGTYQIESRCPKCEEAQDEQNKIKLEALMEEIRQSAEETDTTVEEILARDVVQKRIDTIKKRQAPKNTYNIDLQGILNNNTVEIDEEELKQYHVVLSNGQEVQLSPIKMDSAVAALQFQNEEKNINLDFVEDFVTFMLSCSVISVDGVTNREQIEEWAKNLPTGLKKELDTATEKLSDWGADFNYTITCEVPSCEHERNISTLLNPITFFMTPSESEE